MGKQQYDPDWDLYWPQPKALDISEYYGTGTDPYDTDEYQKRSKEREAGIRPTPSNGMLFVILGVAGLFLAITIFVCCCRFKKQRKDTYVYKTYSQVDRQGASEESLDNETDGRINN
jgi:hypothetical protein